MGQAINIEYVRKMFNHALCLPNPIVTAKQVVNTSYVLTWVDWYNITYGLTNTNYRNSSLATQQIADKTFVDSIINNKILRGQYFGRMPELRGDLWTVGGDEYHCEQRQDFPVTANALVSFNFDFSKTLSSGQHPAWVCIKDKNDLPILLLSGSGWGMKEKFPIKTNSQNVFTVSLEKGQVIQLGVVGTKFNSDTISYGILKNIEIAALLKTNESWIVTPLVISGKNGTITKEFPIVDTATYKYSFNAHHQNFDGGAVNENLVSFSYVYANVETMLFNPSSIPSELYAPQTTGTITARAGGSFVARVRKSSNTEVIQYGIMDCLTIKGTT